MSQYKTPPGGSRPTFYDLMPVEEFHAWATKAGVGRVLSAAAQNAMRGEVLFAPDACTAVLPYPLRRYGTRYTLVTMVASVILDDENEDHHTKREPLCWMVSFSLRTVQFPVFVPKLDPTINPDSIKANPVPYFTGLREALLRYFLPIKARVGQERGSRWHLSAEQSMLTHFRPLKDDEYKMVRFAS